MQDYGIVLHKKHLNLSQNSVYYELKCEAVAEYYTRRMKNEVFKAVFNYTINHICR